MSENTQAPDITGLLKAWGEGDEGAFEQLIPLVYQRLRRLAGGFLRHEREDHTLHTLDLVHESLLRLMEQKQVQWKNQAHFFGLAGQAMRRLLVDHARRRLSGKGGSGGLVQIDTGFDACEAERPMDLLALDEALTQLAESNRELARIVELRYFVGLNREEAAAALGISRATLGRRWEIGRRWLYRYVVLGERDPL